jgi:hypothetical protein
MKLWKAALDYSGLPFATMTFILPSYFGVGLFLCFALQRCTAINLSSYLSCASLQLGMLLTATKLKDVVDIPHALQCQLSRVLMCIDIACSLLLLWASECLTQMSCARSIYSAQILSFSMLHERYASSSAPHMQIASQHCLLLCTFSIILPFHQGSSRL